MTTTEVSVFGAVKYNKPDVNHVTTHSNEVGPADIIMISHLGGEELRHFYIPYMAKNQ